MRGVNPAILASARGDFGQHEDASGIIRGGGRFNPVAASQPSVGWPDAFMSYPSSPPISLTNVHGTAQNPYVIEYKSFESVLRPNKPIRLYNCSYITIRRIDTRKCTMGLVYAENTDHITLEDCRVENIAYEFRTRELDRSKNASNWWQNENDANFYQFNNCDYFTVRRLKGRYGNTEDVFSHYRSDTGTIDDVQWQGATNTNFPTSDGSPSAHWTSSSGTGCMIGDGSGSPGDNITVTNYRCMDSGTVGLAIAGGHYNTYQDCIMYGSSNVPPIGGYSLWKAAYNWDYYEAPCGNNSFLDCRFQFEGVSTELYTASGCAPSITTGTVWNDTSINPNDLVVTL